METLINEITINGKVYVEKGSENKAAYNSEGKKYQMFRTYSAGVFAGYCEKEEVNPDGSSRVVLRNARRIWAWAGAASLSELATLGTSKPNDCKFPAEVDRVELKQVIEVLDITEKAKQSIESVKVWTTHNK